MGTVTIKELFDLLHTVKKSTSDPSIFLSLREDGSGAIESAATKAIFAVWVDEPELIEIIETRKAWPGT